MSGFLPSVKPDADPVFQMKWADLYAVFRGVAWKKLSAHEVDPTVSHGHEFQGVHGLKALLGSEDRRYTVTYMILKDDTDDIESIRSEAKWYDARANQPHRAPEWRLYYPVDVWQIQGRMQSGDLMVMALTRTGELVVMLAAEGSTREAQLRLLFSIKSLETGYLTVRRLEQSESLGFVAASILEELGFANPEPPREGDSELVQGLAADLARSNPISLPAGEQVSALIRASVPSIAIIDDPDGTLVRWIEAEEALFRAWEDQRIARRLQEGFIDEHGKPDVQGYREFSMSLRQSRVSRAGGALEQHFGAILAAHKIRHQAKPSLDGGERPDFLFPGRPEYDDLAYPAERLRMLGAKFTAKDRWRQILNEAKRIRRKHLLTLEAPISSNQLALMRAAELQLVIPAPIQFDYPKEARSQLQSVTQFLAEVRAL
jgi:hypothetical protein